MGNSSMKQHFENAKKTGVLKISNSKLQEFPPPLKQLNSTLRTLDISDNRFQNLPNEISTFIILKHLNVNHNRLNTLPEGIGELAKLESLNAMHNYIEVLPETLSCLSNLKQVYLNNNQLTQFPTMFCGMKHLDILDLSHNKITSVPEDVKNLYVIELNINQNQISRLSEEISNCPRLKTLRMEENCLQIDQIHPVILKHSKISVLAIDGNLFENKMFTSLDGYDAYMERFTAVKKKMF